MQVRRTSLRCNHEPFVDSFPPPPAATIPVAMTPVVGGIGGAAAGLPPPPACMLQLACEDQNESYVSAWFCAPNIDADGECAPVAGILIGKGELETYAFERY